MWDAFNTLGRSGSTGFQPITQQEIQAWQANYGIQLNSWELDSLIAIDNVAAKVAAEQKRAQQ